MKKFLVILFFQFAILIPGAARDWCFGKNEFSLNGEKYVIVHFPKGYLIFNSKNVLFNTPNISWETSQRIPVVKSLLNYNPKENVGIMANLVRKAFSEDEMAFYNKWLKGMGIGIELYFCPDSKKPKEVSFLIERGLDMVTPEKLSQLESLLLSQEFMFRWRYGITKYAIMEYYIFSDSFTGIDDIYMDELDIPDFFK